MIKYEISHTNNRKFYLEANMQISNNPANVEMLCNTHHFKDFFSFDIIPYLEIHTFSNKEIICNEGEPFPYLYYLVKGKAKIYLTHKNGQRTLVLFAQAPCFIGEMGLLEIEPYAKGVTAMEMCTCLALPLSSCSNMLLEDPKFLRNLARILGDKARNRTDNLAKSYAYPFENRFASFILISSCDNIYNEMHTEASEFLNVSYRHLLFTLHDLCSRQILEKHGRDYHILNRDYLERLTDEISETI